MIDGITQEELEQIERFLEDAQILPPDELLGRLASLASNFYDRVAILFEQLEQDIETTLRIVREFLLEKVLNIDISDVSLEDLEKVLPLVTSEKRQLSNKTYEYLFNNYQTGSLNKRDRTLLKEAKRRLKLFLLFQGTIKDVVEFHIQIKKMFIRNEPLNSKPFKDISYLPMFDDIISEKIRITYQEVKDLTPALKQPYLLDSTTYKKIMDIYILDLEEDFHRIEQIQRWKKQANNQEQETYLSKVELKVKQLQRITRGVLFIAFASNQRVEGKLKALREQTYAMEKMVDEFR
jgi:hypothetical protein